VINERSFSLGKQVGEIKAWCEAAANEAKPLGLSNPFKPTVYEELLPHMKEQAERNRVSFHLEKELIRTDLFPGVNLEGIWVFLIYKKPEVLEEYRRLKERRAELEKKGEYKGKERRAVAEGFGRLLGYSPAVIAAKLESS
jgi:hypothetical protein